MGGAATAKARRPFGGVATVPAAAGVAVACTPAGAAAAGDGRGAAMTRLFAPVDTGADRPGPPASALRALGRAVDAVRARDGVFPEQVPAGDPATPIARAAGRRDAPASQAC